MKKIITSGILAAGMLWLLSGCKGSITREGILTYEELIMQGWEAFEKGDYRAASGKFFEAKSLDINQAEAYNGMGWSYFKLDSLEKAVDEFGVCASQHDPSPDLHAGWAFTLNALKEYEKSNEHIAEALLLDADWVFAYGLSLSSGDLYLLRAENYFLLGKFAESLVEVQRLNSTFTANLATPAGIAALASEIERLKSEV